MDYITIPKGGRPRKQYTDTFLQAVADEYKHMTQLEMAAVHNVSPSTITRWIRIARDRGVISSDRKPSR